MTTSESVLSSEDLEFWEENGYVVARRAVPLENCRAAAKAVWDFAAMDADDPETWYSDPPRGIMKEIYQHQALWDNRQHPRVHEAFAQILGHPQAGGQPRPRQHQPAGAVRARVRGAVAALGPPGR